MNFVKDIKNIFSPNEDEEEDDYLDDGTDMFDGDSYFDMAQANPEPVVSSSSRNSKVVNINATTQLKVVLVKPERFEDASAVADHLNNKRTVVLNLESTNKEVSRRLVDFLSGVAYANNGQIKRVANSTFIITPYNVDIMGDLLDELESNGAF
ncbi:MAG: cell division protein SepF [Faecalibacterium sp.]